MQVEIHLPTAALTLGVALAVAALARWPVALAAEGAAVRCDRYDVTFREREDLEQYAEKRRAQTEAVFAKLVADGYVRPLSITSYETSYIAGEAHFVGFACMARAI